MAYLGPEPGIPAPDAPLVLWAHREPHLPPKAGGGGTPAACVSFWRRVERKVEGRRPANVCVASGCNAVDVLLGVEL